MHIEPEDHLSDKDRITEGKDSRGPSVLILAIAVAIIAAIGYYYFSSQQKPSPIAVEPAPTVITPAAPIPAPVMPAAPDIPAPQPVAEPTVIEEVPAEPALTLETSDPDVRAALAEASESSLVMSVLESDAILQRGAGAIDGFSRGLVPLKALALTPPKEKFSTTTVDELTYIDPASYKRYDSYARAIAALDNDLLVANFHRFRGLLEQAYAGFGYSAEDMDNALIRTLDYVLATPSLTEPATIKRKEAIFQYTDPTLEQLTPLQKQLLRMGPENLAMVKRQAEVLRKGLLAAPP